jgi:DNA replication protein
MKQFNGFPARMDFTPIPNYFLNVLLPQIDDDNELRLSLHLFRLLYVKKGYPRFVSLGDLKKDVALKKSLSLSANACADALETALEGLAKRGIFLEFVLSGDGEYEKIYLLHTEANRQVLEKIERGEIAIGELEPVSETAGTVDDLPDIFSLYEQNIGMLTPIIAEQLLTAQRDYPEEWLREAIAEAVSYNKRNWRYISRILENWQQEGKSSGTHRRHPEKSDPDRFFKGKYGHMVRH